MIFLEVCSDPGDIPNAQRSGTAGSYPVNSQVAYTCNQCYTGGGAITCQTNREWSQRPSCSCMYSMI